MAKKRKAPIAEPEPHKPAEEEEESEEEDESESESGSDSSESESSEDESTKRESIRNLLEPFGKEQIIDLIKQAASKDPSLLSKVTRLADSDPTHRKIFVHGLSWDATTEQVLGAFRSYGEIEECKLITDKITGKNKGYGFVLFKTRSSAQKALKQPQKRIGNRTTSCQLASVGSAASASVAASDAGGRKIYVGNVGPNVTAQRLRDFFSRFGEIEEGPSGFDPVTGKARGFAIFVYRTADGAKKALEEPMKVFDGCQLRCKKFVENLNNNNNNNVAANTGNQAVQQDTTMNYGIGMNPAMLGFVGQNPFLGLATSQLGASVGASYGMSSLNPSMIGNYGSQVALQGLGGYPNAQMVPPSIGGATSPMPSSTPPNAQPGYGYSSYFGR